MGGCVVFPEAGKCRLTALLFVARLCLMSASLPAVEIWGQGTGAGLHPVLRLEKAKYLIGESIRFWVGVEVEPPGDTPAAMSPETKLTTVVGAAAADCLARAVLAGVLAAESVAGIPTYRGMLPGAFSVQAQ